MKKQVGVIFGSRSCEREVSIISAVQLMRHADPQKYNVIPVYIHEDGTWYTGEALKDLKTYQPFRTDHPGCDLDPVLRKQSGPPGMRQQCPRAG